MSKNEVHPERPQKTWRMSVTCWRNKATCAQAHARALAPTPTHALTQAHAHTHEYVILIAFTRKQQFANAPQFYVIRALPVFFYFRRREVMVRTKNRNSLHPRNSFRRNVNMAGSDFVSIFRPHHGSGG